MNAAKMPGHQRATLIALSLLLSLAAGSCEHACTLIGCLDGLRISLQSAAPPSAPLQIDIAMITTTPETLPVMTCILSPPAVGREPLLCASARLHGEEGQTIHFDGDEIKRFTVTISRDGNKLSEQTFDAAYTTDEPNGPGCNRCTSAMVNVPLPAT